MQLHQATPATAFAEIQLNISPNLSAPADTACMMKCTGIGTGDLSLGQTRADIQ